MVLVTFSLRFSRKHSKIIRLQKRLSNGWIWRMNRKVLSMELRKIGHNLSTSKPPKIWFLDWMTNVRKFLRSSRQIRVLMAERRSLQEPRTETWSAASDFNWFASRSQHLCCAYVHRGKRVERFTRSSLHQECRSLLTSCYSQFSHEADVGISRHAFRARTACTVSNWW